MVKPITDNSYNADRPWNLPVSRDAKPPLNKLSLALTFRKNKLGNFEIVPSIRVRDQIVFEQKNTNYILRVFFTFEKYNNYTGTHINRDTIYSQCKIQSTVLNRVKPTDGKKTKLLIYLHRCSHTCNRRLLYDLYIPTVSNLPLVPSPRAPIYAHAKACCKLLFLEVFQMSRNATRRIAAGSFLRKRFPMTI